MIGIKFSDKNKGSLPVIFLYGCHAHQKTIKNPISSIRIPINMERIKIIMFATHFDYLNFMESTFKVGLMRGRTTTSNVQYTTILWALLISLHLKSIGLLKTGIDSSASCHKFDTKVSEHNKI